VNPVIILGDIPELDSYGSRQEFTTDRWQTP